MAAENWAQKFLTNAVTSNQAGDLMYMARSPYGITNDAVITWNNFSAQFLQPANNLSEITSPSAARTNLGLGSIAVQSAASVVITGGSAILSTLSAGFIYEDLSGDAVLNPAQTNVGFNYTVAAVDLSDGVGITNFAPGFKMVLTNSSAGDVTFTPFPGEFINGMAELTLAPGDGALIMALPTEWAIIANYSTAAAGFATIQNVQNWAYNYIPDTSGSTTAYTGTATPPLTSYAVGQTLIFKPASNNTTSTPTINLDTLGVANITYPGGAALLPGDMLGSNNMLLSGTGSNFQLLNPGFIYSLPQITGLQSWNFAFDSGAADAYEVAIPLLAADLFGAPGNLIHMYVGNTNTGASTVEVTSVDGTSNTFNIVNQNGSALTAGQLTANSIAILQSDNVSYVLINNPSITGSGGSGTVNTGNINEIAYYAATGTAISGITSANNSVLVTNGTGIPSLSTTLPNNTNISNIRILNSIQTATGATQISFSPSATPVNFINVQSTDTGSAPGIQAFGSDTNVSLQLGTKALGNILLTFGSSPTLMATFTAVTSAIYSFNFLPAASGGVPTIRPVGATNLGLDIGALGTGSVRILNNSTAPIATFTSNGVPVNYLDFRGKSTGVAPAILALGSDTNVGLDLFSQGTGTIGFNNSTGIIGSITAPASPINYVSLGAVITGGTPTVSGTGGDTNVQLNFLSKGTGGFNFLNTNGIVASIAAPASPANYLSFSAVAASSSPMISTLGSDANLNLLLQTKGTGGVTFVTDSFSLMASFSTVASSVNYLSFFSAAAGNDPSISSVGSDTDIDLVLAAKGTGTLQAGTAGSFAANNTVATVLGSLGPTGAHTTVQKWLRLKDNTGTVLFIPCF